jgi:ankyrin repeat protein
MSCYDLDAVHAQLRLQEVNSQDNVGRTALHYACINGHVEMVRSLLSVGSRTDIFDVWANLPIKLAEDHDNNELVPYLQMVSPH